MEFHTPARSHQGTRVVGSREAIYYSSQFVKATARKQQKRRNGCIIITSHQWSHITLQIAELFNQAVASNQLW